jgi:CHAT domain-containing protein
MGVSRIFLVPDGAMSLVPFAGLPLADGAFVVERGGPIHYITAERDLIGVGGRASNAQGLLAVGGPAFDQVLELNAAPGLVTTGSEVGNEGASVRGTGGCSPFQSTRFEPLEGTLLEVQEIARLWPGPLGVADALVGRSASERAIKADAGRYRVLHLATHGFFLDGSCLPQSTSATTRGVGGLISSQRVENPLRLSGLAFAGANRRGQIKTDEDDGILTAEEVAMLDLQGVEWAVLSACDTGVGEIKAGEGVFGLRRAFQVAGARTVIMSLWSVDDQATRAWMRALYEGRFQRQLSTADAVHQASLTVLRDRRARGQSTHPFFWAAFVAAGDWR